MEKSEIKQFFNSLAAEWDENQQTDADVVNFILKKSGIKKGVRVLDVACGTGVLFDYYSRYEVDKLTGIDISENMLKIACRKFDGAELICADAESYRFSDEYDVVMIYNAFPHFPNPSALIENLALAIKSGGRLTVAHGMSMAELERCHSGLPQKISLPLPEKETTAKLMSADFNVDITISNERMYMVSGVKKQH